MSHPSLTLAPVFLAPNHYYSDKSIHDIRVILKEACASIQADYVDAFDVLECSSFCHQLETRFKINLFNSIEFEQYPFVVEIQGGDEIGFIDAVHRLRTFVDENGFVSSNSEHLKHSNHSNVLNRSEKLSTDPLDETPEQKESTFRNVMDCSKILATDVISECLSALAHLVQDDSVCTYTNESDVLHIMNCMKRGIELNDITIQRYAIVILNCMLKKKEYLDLIKNEMVIALNKVITYCDLTVPSSSQLLRECAICLVLICQHDPLLLQHFDI